MNFGADASPSLIDPRVKNMVNAALQRAHETKKLFYNSLFNLGLLLFFLLLLGATLYYKYKGKPTPQEMLLRNREKEKYILQKIQTFQLERERMQQRLITGLPHWDNMIR